MKLKIAFVLTLCAVVVHLYLTQHHYQVNLGVSSGTSICNVNELFDCDTVTVSQFSELFGIPMSVYGLITNIFLALLLLGWMIRWTDDVARLGAYTHLLASFVAGVSVVMALISTLFLKTLCLFCIAAYVLSFVIVFLTGQSQEPGRKSTAEYLSQLTSHGKTFLIMLLLIPVASFATNKAIMTSFGAGDLGAVVSGELKSWQASAEQNWSAKPSFSVGPENAKMVIAEFADYLCVHCFHAAPFLKTFTNANPDIRLEFYSFPLDDNCNDAMKETPDSPLRGDGVRCLLAKTTYCSQKIAQKGPQMHEELFSFFELFHANPGMEYAKSKVDEAADKLGIDKTALAQCTSDPEADAMIRGQANAGKEAGVRGTPSIYINKKIVQRGVLIPVLDEIKKSLKN